MEALKDYPKEFAKLFRPSFNYLIHINMKFLAEDKGLVGNWRSLIVISCMVINYMTQLWNLAYMMSEGKIFEIANLLPPCLVSTQAILKYIVLVPNTPALSSMISELGVLWRSSELDTTQPQARDTLLRRLNLCNGVSYWVGILGTAQYLLSPLAETLLRRLLLQQHAAPLLLPLDCRYPCHVSSWTLYAALYAFQLYTMSLTVCAYLGSELLMITLCALLGVEFTALCDRLQLLTAPSLAGHRVTAPSPAGHRVTAPSPAGHRVTAPSPAGHRVTAPSPAGHRITAPSPAGQRVTASPGPADHTCTLGHIVKRHQTLCLLAKKLDAVFNRMIFINLMFVGLTTCFFRYAAQYSRGPSYMFNNYVAVFSSLLYVLYLCYYGEILTGASSRIGDMAYHSAWYRRSIHHKKAILIIMLRSHTPCCLTSMKYAPVTLNMFTKVISTTWSYFSLMSTVYGDS